MMRIWITILPFLLFCQGLPRSHAAEPTPPVQRAALIRALQLIPATSFQLNSLSTESDVRAPTAVLARTPWTLANTVMAAASDLAQQPATVRPYCRYLALPRATTFPDTVVLLRIDYRDYGWSLATWEKLAEQEPWYHADVDVDTEVTEIGDFHWPGGYWAKYGKVVEAGIYREPITKKKRIRALAPWLSEAPQQQAAVKALVDLSQSQVPIVRADWFIWQTAIQEDRKPGYYDFLGIKDKKTFEELVGFDAKLAAKSKRVELLEAVGEESIVARQPRRLGAFWAISGWYWQSFDNKIAKGERNPLRILNGGFDYDGQENFGHSPNGFLIWVVLDRQGNRLDAVPDTIASDSTSHNTNRRVLAGLSCVRCHGPHSGVHPMDAWARGLFRGRITLQSVDYEKHKELRQKYLRDIEEPMDQTRRVYARAVREATGLTVPEAAALMGQVFAGYDGRVTLERAAADLGMEPAVFQAKLLAYLRRTGQLDLVIATFAKELPGTIGIVQWHEAFSLAYLATR